MDDQLKGGDLVRLKSGGPVMTVDGWSSNRLVVCKWFDDVKHLNQGEFNPISLVMVPESGQPTISRIGDDL